MGFGVGQVQVCWHLANPDSLIFNNAFFGKGWVTTASFLAEYVGAGVVSDYQVFNRQPAKEAVWERIRREEAPNSPSRMGSTYLFETEADADTAIASWFAALRKIKLEALAFSPTVVTLFRADSSWLNRPQVEWEDAARQYWRGVLSAEPMVELLAHGRLYFPGWDRPPFGPMVPSPPG